MSEPSPVAVGHACPVQHVPQALHEVQFYKDAHYLSDVVCRFVMAGLKGGQPALLLARPEHVELFLAGLRASGEDVERAVAEHRLTVLDAQELLDCIMVGDSPQPERFQRKVGGVLRRISGLFPGQTVRAYGELVDLLWREGNPPAALKLEELWNELIQRYPFSLLCGYAASSLQHVGGPEGLAQVCHQHSDIFPRELSAEAEHRHTLAELVKFEQRTRELEAELAERRELERRLRELFLARERAATERLGLERQLQESRRLESIGMLAGGIAHDFNNLLSAILGNADVLSELLPAASEPRELVDEIVVAARRSADLTRQLLAYAGRGQFVVEPLDVGMFVRELSQLLRGALPAGSQMLTQLSDGERPFRVIGDRAQLTQMVMNLVKNAADALSTQQGSVTLRLSHEWMGEARVAELEEAHACKPGALRLGLHVCFEVQDSGTGMTEEVKERMFDPFFSTKGAGRGLGLASVRGIVHAHAGALRVDSAPGQGTTVRVWLPEEHSHPRHEGAPVNGRAHATEPARRRVLITDDNPALRRLLSRMLHRLDYEVSEASNGEEALTAVRAATGCARPFDLVIMDLTMPVMGGRAASDQLAAEFPRLPVLLTSGYSDEPAQKASAASHQRRGFLAKPFDVPSVRAAIAAALES